MRKYEDLSEEEKQALIETCKEDPVIFLETVLGHKLFNYQKVYVREVFKALKKQDEPDFRMQCLNKPVKPLGKIDCPVCGFVFNYSNESVYINHGRYYKHRLVDCPKCKTGIILEGSKFSWMKE